MKISIKLYGDEKLHVFSEIDEIKETPKFLMVLKGGKIGSFDINDVQEWQLEAGDEEELEVVEKLFLHWMGNWGRK